ncbi:polysaccharide biosynthesis protein [Streptomyces sp. RS10V-4]|uniref:Wzz/FepE/Etk N-terminal domain-containing protein n=1 Tax=Streptomyces rhizoryzae TaxID=2932493 RepID=UPI002003F80A|nr:Wzz/FepE/Etk N-terminal domain-containing protein [Streptomyces rhizoryzae]MCK7627032.1 polysaccharide biosynthesis protein [Streptomyces rhizoryzae]
MSDDTIRLVAVGRLLRRRGRLLVLLALLGALAGHGASLVFPPRYTASASVLLPGPWEERELLTQVDLATGSAVVDRVAAALGRTGAGGPDLRDRVSATATEGNIITLSGTAGTPADAQRLADRMAREFVGFAARLAGGAASGAAAGSEALRRQVAETDRRVSDLAGAADPGRTVASVQARTALEKLRTALQEAVKKLDEAGPAAARAAPVVVGPAARPAGAVPPTRGQLVGGGAGLCFLLGVLGHLVAARVDRRPRTAPETAAALGAPLLGTVDVPAERPGGGGPGARVRRFLGLGTRWDAPPPQRSGDEAGRRVRYRRVCARLEGRPAASRGLLVVVPDGDGSARRAAARLVAEAGSGPAPGAPLGEWPVPRVVEVPVDRPLVPDREAESGALVVVSTGRWTAEELAGLAEACADGGHEVVGVVGVVVTGAAGAAGPDRARPPRSAAPPPEDAAAALAVRGRGTGGAA